MSNGHGNEYIIFLTGVCEYQYWVIINHEWNFGDRLATNVTIGTMCKHYESKRIIIGMNAADLWVIDVSAYSLCYKIV